MLTGTDVRCEGNLENLLDYRTVRMGRHPEMAEFCFNSLFYECTALTKAPMLGATTLSHSCYLQMFSGCTALTEAPALPAMTMMFNCYGLMFYGCTALTKPPALPATALSNYCYNEMFGGCTALETVPELPATGLAYACYGYMFSGCTQLKVSETQSAEYPCAFRVPATGTGEDNTYALSNMFINTGGSFTGTPLINTTYYTGHEPVTA